MTMRLSTRAGTTAYPDAQRRPARWGYRALILLTWALCAAIVWWWTAEYLPRFRPGGTPAATPWGRWFGIAGTVLFLILALYGLRRTGYRSRLGRLAVWYRAHLLLGLVALTLLGCHSGFAFRSPFLAALQISFWGTVLTGAAGWALVASMRGWLARHEWQPAVWTTLEADRARLRARLAELGAEAAGVALQRAERELAARRGVLGVSPGRWDRQADEVIARHPDLTPEAGRLLLELNRIEALRGYHRLLRGWTTLHLLFAVAGLQLVVWHVAIVAGH